MFVQWKGKGILVLVFAVVPLVAGLMLLTALDLSLFKSKCPKAAYQIVSSVALIFSGFWNKWSANEYFINDEGEKVYYDFDNRFMWIEMSAWSYVFWVLGGFSLIGGIVELIDYLTLIY